MRVRTALAYGAEKGASAPVPVRAQWDRLSPVPLAGWRTGIGRPVAIRLAHQAWDAQWVRGVRRCGVCISRMLRQPAHGHMIEDLGFFAAAGLLNRGSLLRFFGVRRDTLVNRAPA